jgi:amino acid transporter
MSLIDLIFGKPLSNQADEHERVGPAAGIPIFGLDALGSAAYGPEAALTALLGLGALGVHYVVPLSSAIILLLAIVYFSYRQTIAAYPSGAGAYTVASENLGVFPGLLAAAALMIDYVLVAAVGIAAGVGALVSAIPSLQPHTLLLCLIILAIVAFVNLRGVRSAGLAFMMPTYVFVACLLLTIAVGVVQTILSGGTPMPVDAPPPLPPATEALGIWLLLRAFASGCTAMTGVEAVSNGVGAFREPKVKSAQITLSVIIGILMALLAGIAFLCQAYHIGATVPDQPGYQSVLSQLVAAVAGRGIFYYVTIGSIVLVLALQANTAFADFPRLCHAVSRDGYLPISLAVRGRRLVYSQGIYALTMISADLLLAFGGITDRLIPLFAIGAFLSFTLSQAGMVAHWRKKRGRYFRHSMLINGLGALATAITLGVVIVSKFAEGAWITLLVVPILLIMMYKIRTHYDRVAQEISHPAPLAVDNLISPLAVVPIQQWSRVAQKTLRYAMALSPDVVALHIDSGDVCDLPPRWRELVEEPAAKADLPVPRLVVIKSPYRLFIRPILNFVLELEAQNPGRPIAVVVPELVEKHWWQYFLHRQHGRLLSLLLIFKGNQRISIINVPWHLDAPPSKGFQRPPESRRAEARQPETPQRVA